MNFKMKKNDIFINVSPSKNIINTVTIFNTLRNNNGRVWIVSMAGWRFDSSTGDDVNGKGAIVVEEGSCRRTDFLRGIAWRVERSSSPSD